MKSGNRLDINSFTMADNRQNQTEYEKFYDTSRQYQRSNWGTVEHDRDWPRHVVYAMNSYSLVRQSQWWSQSVGESQIQGLTTTQASLHCVCAGESNQFRSHTLMLHTYTRQRTIDGQSCWPGIDCDC